MNTTIILATISMICAGLASFSNKIATENQILFPTYLLITSLPYIGMVLIVQNNAKVPLAFTPFSVTLGLIGGTLGCIAFYTAFTALSKGGQGSIVFPITSLQVVIAVVLSYLIFKEPITLTKLSGLGFSIIALVLLTR